MYTIVRYISYSFIKLYIIYPLRVLRIFLKIGGRIFASNHRSYADPVFICLPVKARFAYMAKEELFKNPFFLHL